MYTLFRIAAQHTVIEREKGQQLRTIIIIINIIIIIIKHNI